MPAQAAGKPATHVVRRGRAVVRYDRDALSREEAISFATLAARGIRELERLLLKPSHTRLRFELSGRTRISTTRGRRIFLPVHRVCARTAPYLHEIAHVLLPCRRAPAWFSEGLACYLESALSERGGGYDSHLFTLEGNRGVHDDARRWLADRRGRKALPFVGRRGTPAGISADRRNVAAPFYVLSHSLVNFLAEHTGVEVVVRLARAREFARELRRDTGKTATAWRAAWLRELRG
jgi:hypothetical protein